MDIGKEFEDKVKGSLIVPSEHHSEQIMIKPLFIEKLKNIQEIPASLLGDLNMFRHSNEFYALCIFLIGYVLYCGWDVYKKKNTRV